MRFPLNLLLAAVGVLGSCAGKTVHPPGSPPVSAPVLDASLPIPPVDPGHAAPSRSGSATDLPFNSSDVFDYTDNGNSGPGGEAFVIIPVGEDELAWAIFRLQLAADDRPVQIELESSPASLEGQGQLLQSYWLGAYSFSAAQWDWLVPPAGSADPARPGAWNATGTVDVGLNSDELRERYCNLGGEVYFCVLVEPVSRRGEWCGVTVQPSTLEFVNKADPSFYRTAPLPADSSLAVGDGENGGIEVQVASDPEAEADRIYVERRQSSGVSAMRAASTADWVGLGFTSGAGGTYVDPADNINPMAGPPQEGVTYEYRTVAAVIQNNRSFRSAPSKPVKGKFGWSRLTVDDSSGADVGRYTSMAMVQGRPAIAFVDVTNSRLLYIRANDAQGSSWPASPVAVWATGAGFGGLSLALVGSSFPKIPAIAFYDLTTQQLHYIRAVDPLGADWIRPPQVLDTTVDAGHDCDMKFIGVPCIAYADGGTTRALRFISALDALGNSWNSTSDVVASQNAPGDYQDASLAAVNGLPAIAYYDSGTDCLSYVQYFNNSWRNPAAIWSIGGQTCHPSLIVSNGSPAVPLISFSEVAGGLFCVAATDINGDNWGTPFQLDPVGAAGEFASMRLVGGRPAIAYRRLNHQLVFIRTLTGTGTQIEDWGIPKTLDGGAGDFVGMYASLLDVNGRPAITYYADTETELRYAWFQ